MKPHVSTARAASLIAGVTLALASCVRQAPAAPGQVAVHLRVTGADAVDAEDTRNLPGGLRFGGISGLACDPVRDELIGISDDREHSRMVRFRLEDSPFRAHPVAVIPLQAGTGAPPRLDPEGIARLPSGDLLVSSEGIGNQEPRLPPAIIQYAADGTFIRQLEVRPRFAPNPTGPIVTGVHDNEGFESLTISPGASRVFTATETPLAQDGPRPSFDGPGVTRLLEYLRRDGAFVAGREFAYELDAIPRPSFTPGFAINGLAELLALDDEHLLALERAFVENAGAGGSGLTRIRLYRIDLAGATDVSGFDSLRGRTGIQPVRKTRLADLGSAPGLPAALAALDNFEGLSFAPPGCSVGGGLVLVSDDNFSPRQRTWFVRAQLQ